MKPQELISNDKRIVFAIRATCLGFSIFITAVTIMVKDVVVHDNPFAFWIFWPGTIGLIVLGLVQAFWNPYTMRKIKWYLNLYLAMVFMLTTITMYLTTLIYLSWLLLLMVMDVYFSRRQTLFGFGAFVASITIIGLTGNEPQTRATLVGAVVTVCSIGAILVVVSNIRRLTAETIENLRKSQDKEVLEHRRLASLVNSMADGVIAVDDKFRVVLYNAAALNILDRNSSVQGLGLDSIIKPIDESDNKIQLSHLVHQAKVPITRRDLKLSYSDGSMANLYVSIAPVRFGFGNTARHNSVILLRDITHEKSLEEERDEFISVVSHELRTPIAIAEGGISNAQFIAGKTKDKAVTQALDEAHKQVLFLSSMINDLSTLSRAERGNLEVDVEPINIHKFVEDLANDYRADAERKKLEIRTELDPHLELLYSGKLYVQEILQNFITNSIKYTQKGSVTISAKKAKNGVEFAVSDTGIGISKNEQDKIFDKFFRSEDFRTRENSGTGLGLYVTMKLTRLLGAKLSVESELNKGSTFYIFIPDMHKIR